jgi:hypothetical protein
MSGGRRSRQFMRWFSLSVLWWNPHLTEFAVLFNALAQYFHRLFLTPAYAALQLPLGFFGRE